jgi:hypothetical protein
VRMIVPPVSHRREIDRKLVEFFRSHRIGPFRHAVSDICAYYRVRMPRIEWYEYIDWGKTAGKTYEDGRIHLIHPENWKRGRIYKSERMWIQTFYHEMGHYLFWTDAERKADSFQRRMVRGLRPAARRARMSVASRRRPAQRAGRRRRRVAIARRRRRRA